jgi:hypothetical protein
MIYIILVALIVGVIIYSFRKQIFSPPLKKLTLAQENANLVKVLLDLDDDSRAQLFKLYQKQFGPGAARYARQTYQKWKAGSVRPNKQTFRRFLLNLPQVMSFDLKCEVLRELREAYCARDNYNLTVSTDNWKSTLTPLVEGIVEKAATAELPEFLNSRLTWLAEDDVTVANAILAESQARQSRNTISLLEKEFSNIQYLLDNAGGDAKVTHVLQLPLGSITLQIKKGAGNG